MLPVEEVGVAVIKPGFVFAHTERERVSMLTALNLSF